MNPMVVELMKAGTAPSFLYTERLKTIWVSKAHQYLIFVFNLLFALLYSVVSQQALADKIRYSVHFTMLCIAQIVYGSYMPSFYRAPSDDTDKLLARLVVHTLIVEFVNITARQCYSSGLGCKKIGCMLFALCFGSIYGRLLQTAVSDETLLIASSVGVGVLEVVMRLTAFQRDQLIATVAAKMQGKQTDTFKVEGLIVRKACLVVLETQIEIASILYSSAFFLFVCHVKGPLQYQLFAVFNREQMRSLGYKMEDYLLVNFFIQFGIELATDVACYCLEVYVVKIDPPKIIHAEEGDFFTQLQIYFGIFFTLYTLLLSISIFVYPQNFTNSSSPRAGLDLDMTWISIIPNSVELAYFRVWAQKALMK